MIVEYTNETRQQITSVLMWYLYTYRFIDTSKTPSPEQLGKTRKDCCSLYDAKNSELRTATQSAIGRIDDILLNKIQIKKKEGG